MKLLNSISLNMYDGDKIFPVTKKLSLSEAQNFLAVCIDSNPDSHPGRDARVESKVESCIGHADTARVLTTVLGVDVPMNRCTVNFVCGDECIIAQYKGERLPEGATSLPEGAVIDFYHCTFRSKAVLDLNDRLIGNLEEIAYNMQWEDPTISQFMSLLKGRFAHLFECEGE